VKPIKVGTIGYGGAFNMGRKHLQEMMLNPGFVPAAVCDLDPERVKIAQKDFPGIQTYTNIAEMLKKSDVELLVLILPHNLHAKVALQCLKARRHVIVEKPFAITLDECDEMIAAAKKSDRLLSTYHNRHWDANILTIMKHLSKIGRPFRWESFDGGYTAPLEWWRSYKEASGGVIYDWGAHFTEWMLQVMEGNMVEINGYQVKEVWKKFTNEDEVEAVVRFDNHSVASHTSSTICMAAKDTIRINGTKGAIVASHTSVEIYTKDADGNRVRTAVQMEKARGADYYKNVHDHFFHNKKLVITAEWARRVIQVLDSACISSKKCTGVKAKYK
jgi:predicted dehydrogenase